MPVRIVKDNPDEEVVNDSFDFDNPSGNSDNQNYENNQDNQNSDNYNNGGNSNNSSSGFDLSSIANMLFGGGGRGNSALSSLSSLAIGACVNYAVNYFQQSRSNSTSSSSMQNTGSSRSQDDLEALYQARMAASTVCVSLWGYAVGADRDFNQDEEQAVGRLLEDTIQNLFPSNVANQDEVRQELTEIFNNPIPYEDITGQASQDRNFAMQLYQQAALIVAADGSYQGREQDFLNNLAQDLGLSSSDVNPIHRKFGL